MNLATPLRILILTAAVALSGCSSVPSQARRAPDLHLPVPGVEADRSYLGLAPEGETFLLQDIQCEVLFVDCFDMYCHSCHLGARRVNELYRLVQERGLGSRLKFIGLGLNNTPLEAATFKRKFDVPFPIFPDRSRDVSDQFGRARLPSMLVVCNRTPELRLIHQHNGTLDDPETFLDHILEEMKQDCPDPTADQVTPLQDCSDGLCGPPLDPDSN